MDLREYCMNICCDFNGNRKIPVLYEDDFIALFGYGRVSCKGNDNLSLCDNLDYKNDLQKLPIDTDYGLYELSGDHVDRIRGKLVQIPRIFKYNPKTDMIEAYYCELVKDCILIKWTSNPLLIWFKNCKLTKVGDINTEDVPPILED